MRLESQIVFLLCIIISVSTLNPVYLGPVNPGAKIRLSQKALDYGANIAVDILTEVVSKAKIPDQRGKSGKVQYDVRNIRIVAFRRPMTSVRLEAGKGLTWLLSNLYINVRGDFKYKLGVIRGHGSFDAYVSGVSGSVSVTLLQNPTTGLYQELLRGGLTISSRGCSFIIQRLRIKFHGGASWFYNLFHKQIEKPIRKSLERVICVEARKAIDVSAARTLSTLPVTVTLGKEWLLDYRLVSQPLFTPSYLQSAHKAEFFHVNDRTEAPFQADPLPDTSPVDRMITIWMSDYLLNTAGYSLYRRGILTHTLTARELPPEYRGYLDTTCHTTKVCLGTLFPKISKMYPNASVELKVSATEPLKALITSDALEGRAVGSVVNSARLSDGSLAHLFTVNVSVILSFVPKLDSTTIKGKVIKLTPEINVTNSSVGEISGTALAVVFKLIEREYIVPQVNLILEQGFPLPMIKHVRLDNVNITKMDHALCITTDVKYVK